MSDQTDTSRQPFVQPHEFALVPVGHRCRAVCSCGWQSIGLDRAPLGAAQAWSAHMYATGHRTAASITAARAAATPA